jgi:hypothetical protein
MGKEKKINSSPKHSVGLVFSGGFILGDMNVHMKPPT